MGSILDLYCLGGGGKKGYFEHPVAYEAQHAVALRMKRAIRYFDRIFLIGLTATDERPGKCKLETVFDGL